MRYDPAYKGIGGGGGWMLSFSRGHKSLISQKEVFEKAKEFLLWFLDNMALFLTCKLYGGGLLANFKEIKRERKGNSPYIQEISLLIHFVSVS